MPESLTVPLEEYKKVLEVAKALEDEKVSNMDPDTRASYYKSRAFIAEEELGKVTLSSAKAKLQVEYPAADPDETDGKTVGELEASFKKSDARNKKAYERASEKVLAELAEKTKESDELVKTQVNEIFKAWGQLRQPGAEDTAIETDQAARAAMKDAGVNLDRSAAPTTIDDIIMNKLPQVGAQLFRKK